MLTPLLVAGPAAVFAFAYAAVGLQASGLTALYIRFGPVISVISWTVADLQGTQLAAIQDWGLFQFIAWPILVPWCLKRRHGKGAWALVGIFLALLVAPALARIGAA